MTMDMWHFAHSPERADIVACVPDKQRCPKLSKMNEGSKHQVEHNYIIGIDAGTSKIKSVLFDRFGHELFTAEEDVRLITPAHGLVEQDMNEAWESTFRTVKSVLDQSGVTADSVAAIAITGQADGIWLVGEDGEPVCNSYNWTDGRALSKCIEWIMTGVDA